MLVIGINSMYNVQRMKFNQREQAEKKLRKEYGEYVWYKLPFEEREQLIKEAMQSKYRNIETEYNGIKYQSSAEAKYALDLDSLKKAKEIVDWERQVTIPLDVNGNHICNYRIDFKVYHKDGTTEYVEVKGFATEEWRLKWKLFEALYTTPDTKLTIIKA